MPQKTIKEWLQELPEPYRTEALKNCDTPDLNTDCLTSALVSAFSFIRTKQGYNYWEFLYDKLILEGK